MNNEGPARVNTGVNKFREETAKISERKARIEDRKI